MAGVAFRIAIVASPLGLVDGDEAVVGLMARRMLEGSFEAFFWGQEYGGTQEAALVAALLAVGIPGRWAMELVPIGLHAGAAVLVWRIGLRAISRPGGAALAGGLCWAASPALVWWSTKERGFYGFTLVCGLASLLMLLRLSSREGGRPPWLHAGALGLALGLGWWASPQILHFALPGIAWLAWTSRRRLGHLAAVLATAAPAAVVGALPWLWANLHSGFASLEPAAGRTTFGEPLPIFFDYSLPMVLGLMQPLSLRWELPAAELVYVVAVVGVAAVVVLGPAGLAPARLAVGVYPVVFALLPTTYYYGEPRYLAYLWPLLALLGGWALARAAWPAQLLAVLVAVGLTAHGIAGMAGLDGPGGEPLEDLAPAPVEALVAALDGAGADRVLADYWVAHRLTWESEGRIVATPLSDVRDPVHDALVRNADHPVLVVPAATCGASMRALLDHGGTGYRVTPAGQWEVIVPDRRVTPEEVRRGC